MKAYVFPGQGSQKPGMGKDIYDSFSEAAEIYKRAEKISGKNWAEISFEADKQALAQTQNTQPCIYLHSVAILECLGTKARFKAVAGHSLGEYSALYAAGIISFADALRSVILRGQLMSQAKSGGMLAVLGADLDKISRVIDRFAESGIATIANYNAPSQIVVSAESQILESLSKTLSEEAGAKRVMRLPVSAAFHSPLMEEAKSEMAKFIGNIEFREPRVDFYCNASGQLEPDPKRIKALLIDQITSPVRWIDQIRQMDEHGYSQFVEIGPGKVLQGLIKKILDKPDISGIETTEQIVESME